MGYFAIDRTSDLKHYGVLGMKWGIRRYQNEDGTLTAAGKERYLGINGIKHYKTAKEISNMSRRKRRKAYERERDSRTKKFSKNFDRDLWVEGYMTNDKFRWHQGDPDDTPGYKGPTKYEKTRSREYSKLMNEIDTKYGKEAVSDSKKATARKLALAFPAFIATAPISMPAALAYGIADTRREQKSYQKEAKRNLKELGLTEEEYWRIMNGKKRR